MRRDLLSVGIVGNGSSLDIYRGGAQARLLTVAFTENLV